MQRNFPDSKFAPSRAEVILLEQSPLRLVRTAREQNVAVRARVLAAVPLILINDCSHGNEVWWGLAQDLKQPLLTLSLMPGAEQLPSNGSASQMQLRRWQLEQLAGILKAVDETCLANDSLALANALEQRVLPWQDSLQITLDLWLETLLLGQIAMRGPSSRATL